MAEEAPHNLDGGPADASPVGVLRELVFGAEDGLVSILGLVTGVAAGTTSSAVVLLAGVAGALSGAVSMAAGTYLGVKSETEVLRRSLSRERRSIEQNPEHERAELIRYYRRRGFTLCERRIVIPAIMRNKELLMEEMAAHEYGISPSQMANPIRRAFWIFAAYLVVSTFPVIPYSLFARDTALIVSIAGTTGALFAVGAAKTIFTGLSSVRSGLEMLIIGALAGIAGYLAGHFAALSGV